MQASPYFEMDYPYIWGTDVAGTIVQLGVNVTRFKLGQRVIGYISWILVLLQTSYLIALSTCDGLITRKVPNSGFQLYSTCLEVFVAEVPNLLPLANAAVLPNSVSTAASALFIDHKLPFPTLNPKSTGKTILIWGGSSSCGSSAIQLATAAGCSVATTASSANFEYVKSLGASHIFDRRNPKIVDELLKILKPGDLIVDCIGTKESQVACGEILGKIGGGKLPILNPPQVQFPDNVEANFGMYLPAFKCTQDSIANIS
jgi:NADPH:quinone reductase-like Zn-dependent oxidoreductase